LTNDALKASEAERWTKVKLTNTASALKVAARLVDPTSKARYQAVASRTGVPWFVIAVIHEREASQRWGTQLGQGDPIDRVSVHAPAGRGPFMTWDEGAYDALVNCAPHAARNTDWSPGGALTVLEQYNGLGYAAKGRPSPYLWSGTDQYVSGKYVRDGVYDADVVDSQLGCAALIKAMMALDPSIVFGRPGTSVPLAPSMPASVPPTPRPSITTPANGSIGAAIASLIVAVLSIFKRK